MTKNELECSGANRERGFEAINGNNQPDDLC